ncbi:MAG: bifunctional phosphopantothenoylcysteine decarboxylase/phosphopantothenate--cysteine ligase CoaBC [Clostridia bacterium]|nr:bifunctional phosphopantothenoylcysteine decarboxylase/phosphopantothenate--cysteine ligase CoaBC [Clostridia bacterium]
MLSGKNIVVGVCGGIAAYKTVDVVSRLKKLGANVDVIMTKNACEFVTPLTFRSISKTPVITDTFNEPAQMDIAHISLAKKADAFLIAPATANIIGKIACGIADDMLSTTIMAAECPVIIAPAMNTKMYENSIVQENIERLTRGGYYFIEPDTGMLACGVVGKGRLAPIEDIVEYVCELVAFPKDLAGLKILVTAGPTHEPIDPVRYITNHSTGKMGYAIARAAKYRGAEVTLISGPTHLRHIRGVKLVDVYSALEMYDAVMDCYDANDIIVKSAAVADFRAENTSEQKIKKESAQLDIKLTGNPDILAELGKKLSHGVLVGFCMETENALENAKKKLDAKNLDMIVLNEINKEGAGFAADTNIVTIIDRGKNVTDIPKAPKQEIADAILTKAFEIFRTK